MSDQSVYAAPNADLATAEHAGDYPGMRRLPYFGWSIVIQFVYYALLVVAGESPAVVLLSLAVVMSGSIYLLVQRLRNTGSNGWWAALILVPLVNIYIGIKAMAFPEGYDDHLKFTS